MAVNIEVIGVRIVEFKVPQITPMIKTQSHPKLKCEKLIFKKSLQ